MYVSVCTVSALAVWMQLALETTRALLYSSPLGRFQFRSMVVLISERLCKSKNEKKKDGGRDPKINNTNQKRHIRPLLIQQRDKRGYNLPLSPPPPSYSIPCISLFTDNHRQRHYLQKHAPQDRTRLQKDLHRTLLCAHDQTSEQRGGSISLMVLCPASQPPHPLPKPHSYAFN